MNVGQFVKIVHGCNHCPCVGEIAEILKLNEGTCTIYVPRKNNPIKCGAGNGGGTGCSSDKCCCIMINGLEEVEMSIL